MTIPSSLQHRALSSSLIKPLFGSGKVTITNLFGKNILHSGTRKALKHTATKRKPSSSSSGPKKIRDRHISTAKPLKTTVHKQDSYLLNSPKSRGRNDDSLSRYPNVHSPGGILRGLDYIGTITFALSGSITAAQSGLDVFGCSVVAMITAVGGGTIRDAVMLARKPFWTSETEYVWMTVLTGFITFFTWPKVLEWNKNRRLEDDGGPLDMKKSRSQGSILENEHEEERAFQDHHDGLNVVMHTFDGIGLSAFAIIGAQNGVRAGMPVIVSAICGMGTSTFGGVMRDVICGRPVRIVHSNAEIYAEAALAGSIMYLGANSMKLSPGLRIGSAMLVCLSSRYLAVKHDVKLYTWETEKDNDGLGVAIRK